MPVSRLLLVAALLGAAPALAGGRAQAPAPKPPAAQAPAPGSCCMQPGSSCGVGVVDEHGHSAGDSAVIGPGGRFNEEAWRALVARKLAEAQVEPPDPDPFGFGVYRGRRPEPMGTQTLINGARMAMAHLYAEDAPHLVEKAYRDTFVSAGMVPVAGEVPSSPGVRYVSFRLPGSRNLKTVTLVPQGPGTLVLASVGNPEELLQQQPALPVGVPVPPNAEAPSVLQQLEPGMSMRSAFFVVRGATAEQVRDFYRRELPRQGFRPSEAGEADNYEKPGLLLSLSAVAHPDPGAVAVSLVWFEE